MSLRDRRALGFVDEQPHIALTVLKTLSEMDGNILDKKEASELILASQQHSKPTINLIWKNRWA